MLYVELTLDCALRVSLPEDREWTHAPSAELVHFSRAVSVLLVVELTHIASTLRDPWLGEKETVSGLQAQGLSPGLPFFQEGVA